MQDIPDTLFHADPLRESNAHVQQILSNNNQIEQVMARYENLCKQLDSAAQSATINPEGNRILEGLAPSQRPEEGRLNLDAYIASHEESMIQEESSYRH